LENASQLGVNHIDRIVEVVEETLKGNKVTLLGKTNKRGETAPLPSLDLPKVRKNKFVEIIPVNTGCLGSCSYCKTKYARGTLNSYTTEAILKRIESVCGEDDSKIQEIWLTSEDLGAYGLDIGTNIAKLLVEITLLLECRFPNVMLRLGMTNPPYILEHVSEICRILNHPNVFSFLHIPVQSGSDNTLRHMIREYTVQDFETVVDRLKLEVEDVLIATDVICGFPTGEIIN
jgi:threonylcarbamoyladenosine tRNA methylthiotransferase CDKAL1